MPLDPKYHPHRPISLTDPEAGHFWVTVASVRETPTPGRPRMTVVGRVIGTTNQEPILLLMYARGWDYSGKNGAPGEDLIDRGRPSIPDGLHGEFQRQLTLQSAGAPVSRVSPCRRGGLSPFWNNGFSYL